MTTIAEYDDIVPERIMMLGQGGEGKSTLFETLPGRKLMLAFERNAITALKAINPKSSTEFELFSPGEMNFTVQRVPSLKGGDSYQYQLKRRADAYAAFEKYCEEKLASGYFDQFDWIAIDGGTQLARAMLDDVLAREGRLGYVPEMSDYNVVKFQMERVLRFFCAVNAGFYFVVHVSTTEKDEVTKRLVDNLILPGDLKNIASTMFSQVFRTTTAENEKGELRFMIQTRPDSKLKGPRTSIRGLPTQVDVTIESTLMLERTGLGKILSEKAGFQTKKARAKLAERKLAEPPKEEPPKNSS